MTQNPFKDNRFAKSMGQAKRKFPQIQIEERGKGSWIFQRNTIFDFVGVIYS
jgi:hypothetical protein